MTVPNGGGGGGGGGAGGGGGGSGGGAMLAVCAHNDTLSPAIRAALCGGRKVGPAATATNPKQMVGMDLWPTPSEQVGPGG